MAGALIERLRAGVAYYRSLLSFRGRLDRLGYWRAVLALVALLAVTLTIGYGAIILAGPPAALLLLPALPAFVANAAITVRRLHDRGKSGWWIILFVVIPPLVSGLIAPPPSGGVTLAMLLVALVSLGLQVWGLIEIGFRSGVEGGNRYGSDPRLQSAHEAFA